MRENYAAVICPTHGQVLISEEEYERQLGRANQRWRCTKCGEDGFFDDEYFETRHCYTRHAKCHSCGGEEFREGLAAWDAQSSEDPKNTATLWEHQCMSCGESFWTASEQLRGKG